MRTRVPPSPQSTWHEVGELPGDPQPAAAVAERPGGWVRPDRRPVEAAAHVRDLHHQAAVNPGLDRDRRRAVLLGVGDHLVEREHQVAGAVAEALIHGDSVHRGADLGDSAGSVPSAAE